MRELMFELLTYEPYGKVSDEEAAYILGVLSGDGGCQPAKLHDLFVGFYGYVCQGDYKNIEWLRLWREKYICNKDYNNSKKDHRDMYPLLYKKICFYSIVNGGLEDKDFMGDLRSGTVGIGSSANRLRKWGVSTQFRKLAQQDTYSVVKSYRNGIKKPYEVGIIKKLYFEAGRQVSGSQLIRDLPVFIDCMSGTAAVAASVNSGKGKAPVVNDRDVLMVCYAWAFTYCQKEIRRSLADRHNNLMMHGFGQGECLYGQQMYNSHYGFENGEYSKSCKAWVDESLSSVAYWDSDGVISSTAKYKVKRGKKYAETYQSFILKIRESFLRAEKAVRLFDKERFSGVDFNALPTNEVTPMVRECIDIAVDVFYYFSFKPKGIRGNAFHVSSLDENNYYRYLHKGLGYGLERGLGAAEKVRYMTKLRLMPSKIRLGYRGDYAKSLHGAKFYHMDYRQLAGHFGEQAVYFYDSPYYLMSGYMEFFSDKDHKELLDTIRDAGFKWIFAMQYNMPDRKSSTRSEDEQKRNTSCCIKIKDYGTYYKGFLAPFGTDNGSYISSYSPDNSPSGLYIILFDKDAVRLKYREVREINELLVCNFNPIGMIPYRDIAVAMPYEKFIECAEKHMAYEEIALTANEYRRSVIMEKLMESRC